MENLKIQMNSFNNAIDAYFEIMNTGILGTIFMIVDILIIGYCVYKLIVSAKNSRVGQLIKGIFLILLIILISIIFQLDIVNYILTSFVPYAVIAVLVIFQPELRRILEQLGTNKLKRFFGIVNDKDVESKTKEDIYKIVVAVKELSMQKIGALIVVERDIQMKEICDTGIKIDAEVSPQLLVNIFVPKTPLHDGAVVISKNKIDSAACILPLANDKHLENGLGTRHRAAIGVSRETDAIAIIVSEENGKISLAKDGVLIIDLKEEALKSILVKHIITKRFGDQNEKH